MFECLISCFFVWLDVVIDLIAVASVMWLTCLLVLG